MFHPGKRFLICKAFSDRLPQGKALVARIFRQQHTSASTASADIFGMWGYQERIYEVVGVPLVFNSDPQANRRNRRRPHHGRPANRQPCRQSRTESGLPGQLFIRRRRGSIEPSSRRQGGIASAILSPIGRFANHSTLASATSPIDPPMDPLIDPSSGLVIGHLLIQSDLKESRIARQKVSKRLLASMIVGLLAAAIASFLVSGAVTKPVRDLSLGVQRLAQSDLDVTVAVRGKGELAALATAFNDMVRQLRARRELERLVEESRHEPGQERISRQHEPRNPNAAQRRDRDGGSVAANDAKRSPATICRHGEVISRSANHADQ